MSSESQQDQYSPDRSESPRIRLKKLARVKPLKKDQTSSIEGKWTDEENIKYVLFMDYHSTIFSSKERRKSVRIFKSLAKFLESRTARQCRSHFQKIMNKFKKLTKVKQFYQQLIGPLEYQNRLEAISQVLRQAQVKVEEQKNHSNTECQTDPMEIRLLDLPNQEIIRLMNLLHEHYRSQSLTPLGPFKGPFGNGFQVVSNNKAGRL